MRAFTHPDQLRHTPRFFLQRGQLRANFEVPERANALLAGLERLGITAETAAAPDRAALEAAHAPDYLDFLEGAVRAWAALPNPGPEVVANIHATADALANGARRPSGIIGQAGWYTADTACPIGPGTWAASHAAAGVALAAAAEATAGRQAYALCRPPGHHAYRARAGGHCYLNNAAIAVAALRRAGAARVAVLDIDSHHGNGTQGIFWEDPAVLTVSVHGDPANYYPFFTGYAEERGGGPGLDGNCNLPLPPGTGDSGWLEAVDQGIAAVRQFGAEAVVVSLGFDPSEHEPLGLLKVTADGFARAGAAISRLGLPAAIIQEGGYNVEIMGQLLARFLTGWGQPVMEVHAATLTLDSHVDIRWPEPPDPLAEGPMRVDFPKMQRGGLRAAVFIAYVGQGRRDAAGHAAAAERVTAMLHYIRGRADGEARRFCATPDELEACCAAGALAVLSAVENGYAMGQDLAAPARWRALGACYLTLTHDGHNDLADSARPQARLNDPPAEHGGLSALGRQAIGALNRAGMLVDVSHVAKSAMLQAAEASRSPIVATHTACRALCDHPRGIDDEQLDALRAVGGLAQITAMPSFLKRVPEGQRNPASVEGMADHVDHAVRRIGLDHVGLSSDFDGGGAVEGWQNAAETANLTAALMRRGYGAREIGLLWSGNFLRIWRQAQTIAG